MNTTEGDPSTRAARAELQHMQGADLVLVDGPLTPEAYGELFRQADILLLPYRSGAYAERSSGILMEAIVAGTPSVVTRGAWMEAVLAAGSPQDPAGVVTDCDPAALADAVLRIASDWPRYAGGARALRDVLRPRYDPAELVALVAG